MNNKVFVFGQKIYEWLSQFAPTYRGVLPNNVKPEDLYLRFDGYFDNFATQFIFPVIIYRLNTTSYSQVILLADEIESAIGESGIVIGDENMRIHIEKGSPFYQDRADENDTVRSGYINLIISIYAVGGKSGEQKTYTVSFYADGVLVGKRNFTQSGQKIIPPAVPEKEGYVGYWEDFNINVNVGDISVNAIYVPRNNSLYSATFFAGDDEGLRQGEGNTA